MNQQVKIKKHINRQNQIPIVEQCSIFLQIYSSELKYMVPWAQYDDNMAVKDNNNSTDLIGVTQERLNTVEKTAENVRIDNTVTNLLSISNFHRVNRRKL
jgi:hypothetical protein